jgi:hypothetical protein
VVYPSDMGREDREVKGKDRLRGVMWGVELVFTVVSEFALQRTAPRSSFTCYNDHKIINKLNIN